MENWIESGVKAYYGRRRGTFGKHPSGGSDSVVVPVKIGILLDVLKIVVSKKINHSVDQAYVDIDLIVFPVRTRNHVHLNNVWFQFRRDADSIIKLFPVSTDENDALNAVSFCLPAELEIQISSTHVVHKGWAAAHTDL